MSAAAFAATVIQNCSGCGANGGTSSELEDAVKEVDESIQEDRYSTEGNAGMNERYLASTKTEPPGSVGNEVLTYQTGGDPPNLNPGTNINPDLLDVASRLPGSASNAALASILVHEGAHVAGGHSAGDPYAECEAIQVEAEFLKCATAWASVNLTGLELQRVMDTLCARMERVANQYYCEEGCGILYCVATACSLTIHCASQAPGITPSTVVPRPQIDAGALRATTLYYGTGGAFFSVTLYPCSDLLSVGKFDGVIQESWNLTIASQAEGDFQPLSIRLGRAGQLFVAGRLTGNQEPAIYRFDFGWTPSGPVYSPELIYRGFDVGDVLDMGFAQDFNNKLILFDYTNARLLYLDLAEDNLLEIASYSEFPQILEMLCFATNLATDDPSGAPNTLLLTMEPRDRFFPRPLYGGFAALSLWDRLGDGTIDQWSYDG